MNPEVTTKDIAAILGVSDRAIQIRAQKEQWIAVTDKVRGGREKRFAFAMLPPDVRNKMAVSDAEQMGLIPINPGALEIRTHRDLPSSDTALPERAKNIGLAKFRLVRAYRQAIGAAPWGGKVEAASAFLLAYNTGRLLPGVYAIVGEVREPTLRALDAKLSRNNDDFTCLCDGRGGWKMHGVTKWRERQLSKEAQLALLSAYLSPTRPSVQLAIRAARYALQAKGVEEATSDTTMRRWLDDYCRKHADVVLMGRDSEKACKDKMGAYIDRDPDSLEVGGAIVSDGKVLNFTVRHPVTGTPCRMTLIAWIDWKSRYPVGWQIMPTENTVAISAALRMAIKTLGKIPTVAYMDNGAAFTSKFFTTTNPDLEMLNGLYARLGITVVNALPYNGRAKINERWHLSLQEQCERLLPTYTGASISDKPAHLMRNEKFHQAWHDAKTSGWVPDIREASRIVGAYIEWFVREPHDGLKRRTPLEVFEEGKGPGMDVMKLNHEFLWREIIPPRRCRVRLYGIDYESDALYGIDHKVMVMFDTADMGRVYLYDLNGRFMDEALPVESIAPLAAAFGDVVGMDRVKYEIRRQNRQLKQTKETFVALGVMDKDALKGLPYNQRVPVMLPEQSGRKQIEVPRAELPDAEVVRLETMAEQAAAEGLAETAPDRPALFHRDIDRYEWCFYTLFRDGYLLPDEDQAFMAQHERTREFIENHQDRFDGLREIYGGAGAASVGGYGI